ncbi:hypothetical protein NPIL_602391 [Nephila pilipes]|uniref:Uncharacterized protein n=1 Tax=Nephila pilipes TaxID=299642 RepID=A0A8X6U3Q1_NEPPI|nr:hypothetical protein NPIL_602391 [Nephila pilipes]
MSLMIWASLIWLHNCITSKEEKSLFRFRRHNKLQSEAQYYAMNSYNKIYEFLFRVLHNPLLTGLAGEVSARIILTMYEKRNNGFICRMLNSEEIKSEVNLKVLNIRKGNRQAGITTPRTSLKDKTTNTDELLIKRKLEIILYTTTKIVELKLEYYNVLFNDQILVVWFEEMEGHFEKCEVSFLKFISEFNNVNNIFL